MFKRSSSMNLLTGVFALLLAIGCGKDKTTTSTTNNDSYAIQMVDVGQIIESVAPPEYVSSVSSPTAIDTMWTTGQSPLLDKVFGSTDPQTLYANINDFKLSHDIIASTLRVDANGAIVPGIYVDSHLVTIDNGTGMIHFTATATALDGPTTIPAIAQSVIGTSVDLDYLISVAVDEMPDGVIRIGMTLNDSIQTIFQWDEGTDIGNETSRLYYATLDPTDSSFVFKGMGYCQHPVSTQWPNGDRFCWAYNITSDANSDFSYRMSYFSNGTPGMTFLHTFLGGGNKDTEFALRYRLFSPADTTVYDSYSSRDQVFGPNYTEGTGLISDYASYLNESLIFPYSSVPQEMIPNPWL